MLHLALKLWNFFLKFLFEISLKFPPDLVTFTERSLIENFIFCAVFIAKIAALSRFFSFFVLEKKTSFIILVLTEPLINKQPSRGVLKKRCFEIMQQIYRKNPCRSVISIKLLFNFIEIALQHVCSPVNLWHIFKTPFSKNTSRRLLL